MWLSNYNIKNNVFLPLCLGIFLVVIIIVPNAFANEFGTISVEKSVYEVASDRSVLVKLYGFVENPRQGDRVEMVVTHPDDSTSSLKAPKTSKGYFETYINVEYEDRGNYSVSAEFSGNSIGTVTFEVTKYGSEAAEQAAAEAAEQAAAEATAEKAAAEQAAAESVEELDVDNKINDLISEAKDLYNSARDLACPNEMCTLVTFTDAVKREHDNKLKSVIKLCDEVLELDPRNIGALKIIGKSYLLLENYDTAGSYFDIIISIDPKYPNAYYNKALVYEAQNNLPLAIKYWDKAIEAEPDATNWKIGKATGISFYCENNSIIGGAPLPISGDIVKYCNEAIELYDWVLEQEPDKIKQSGHVDKINVQYMRATVLVDRNYPGDQVEAIEIFDTVLESDPIWKEEVIHNKKVTLNLIGLGLLNQNKYSESILYFNKILEIDPNHPDAVYNKQLATSYLCGEGTVLVNGVCQLDKSSATPTESVMWSLHRFVGIDTPAQLVITIIPIAVICAVAGMLIKRKRSKAPKPAKQDLDDYEEQYLARQGQRPTRKPAETKPASRFCETCGNPLKPHYKFCNKCGSSQ